MSGNMLCIFIRFKGPAVEAEQAEAVLREHFRVLGTSLQGEGGLSATILRR